MEFRRGWNFIILNDLFSTNKAVFIDTWWSIECKALLDSDPTITGK